MYKSPGPCYSLPQLIGTTNHDPRSNHVKGPAYPIVGRAMKISAPTSPGPCYYPAPNIVRTGRCASPTYTLHFRHKMAANDSSPGPARYEVRYLTDSNKPNPPSFTFGQKHRSKSFDQFPGPCSYNISGLVGSKLVMSRHSQSPSYTLPSRLTYSETTKRDVPGPGAYTIPPINKYLPQSPIITIGAKNPHNRSSRRHRRDLDLEPLSGGYHDLLPGPAAYKRENVWLNKKEPPSYTFGIKHSEYETNFIHDSDLAV
ncbi:hypothetical protein HELRODRAFT_62376 [Helobdella robusta]|uniref:Uncharacterized protein n=1 Tax=Helobdella robusta TaxID=6412 RepID=T1FWZ9_HELRO|nr:hypothetical protein HELRODRAFT_62376 [Helobdella robusta]ESO13151.1 hypothetical protein HELRODRAFT_62376 [Helobdella robusta]